VIQTPRGILPLVRIGCFLEESNAIRRPVSRYSAASRNDRYVTAAATFGLELHRAGRRGEQGVVTTQADVRARVELGAALTHEDVAGQHALAAELLHAKALGF